jgi:hypothetical protein
MRLSTPKEMKMMDKIALVIAGLFNIALGTVFLLLSGFSLNTGINYCGQYFINSHISECIIFPWGGLILLLFGAIFLYMAANELDVK